MSAPRCPFSQIPRLTPDDVMSRAPRSDRRILILAVIFCVIVAAVVFFHGAGQ